MFGQKQTLMLHLFTTTNIALRSMFGRAFVHDFLIRPYLLPLRLRAQICRVFVEEILPEMLEEIPLSLRRNMFQHDGAAAYFARPVREHLTAAYNDR